jgi:MOSC domain-containing protein YiiM
MIDVTPGRTLKGRVAGLFHALGDTFETEPVSRLELTFDGIEGDRHAGMVRKATAREPWHSRNTVVRNERQLSILSPDELAAVAEALKIPQLPPEWVGANIVIEGIPHLTRLPPRTILMFEGGATVRIDGDNAPCRKTGAAISRHVPGRPDIELGFVGAARHRRGLVGWVESEGRVKLGEIVTARIWEQPVYPGLLPETA